MIGISASFVCAEGKNAEFEKLLTEFVTTVKANEPGTVVYQLCKDEKTPNGYFMLELYADEDAFKAHGKTAHMAELVGKIGPLLGGAPKLAQGPALF
jgi:quinol monooxygenase YgiN